MRTSREGEVAKEETGAVGLVVIFKVLPLLKRIPVWGFFPSGFFAV